MSVHDLIIYHNNLIKGIIVLQQGTPSPLEVAGRLINRIPQLIRWGLECQDQAVSDPKRQFQPVPELLKLQVPKSLLLPGKNDCRWYNIRHHRSTNLLGRKKKHQPANCGSNVCSQPIPLLKSTTVMLK